MMLCAEASPRPYSLPELSCYQAFKLSFDPTPCFASLAPLSLSAQQNSVMRAAARCAAFVLLLGAALATVPGKPTVWDIRGGWHRRSAVSVSVASASQGKDSYNYDKYDNYGYEEKEVCLQEVERKSCHTHLVEGCDDSGSGGGCGGSCDCDRVHSFWT